MSKICIVGGGSSTICLAALLHQNVEFSISLLTRSPECWSPSPKMLLVDERGNIADEKVGKFQSVSDDPAIALRDADHVIIVAPVSAYASILKRLRMHIPRQRAFTIGFLYGQGGVNWLCEQEIKKHGLEKVEYWSFGLIPWVSRAQKYGEVGNNYGAKERNVVCASSQSCLESVLPIIRSITVDYFEVGQIHEASRFVELTLSVDNQLIHTTRCYGLHKSAPNGWKSMSEVPYFYRDYDHESADLLIKVDHEFDEIRARVRQTLIGEKLDYMLPYLALERFSYNSDHSDVLDSFVNSRTLHSIRTPVRKIDGRFQLDASHRFFHDDTFFGLQIMCHFANHFGIQIPNTRRVLNWCEKMLESQGITNAQFPYGTQHFKKLTIEQLLD